MPVRVIYEPETMSESQTQQWWGPGWGRWGRWGPGWGWGGRWGPGWGRWGPGWGWRRWWW